MSFLFVKREKESYAPLKAHSMAKSLSQRASGAEKRILREITGLPGDGRVNQRFYGKIH